MIVNGRESRPGEAIADFSEKVRLQSIPVADESFKKHAVTGMALTDEG